MVSGQATRFQNQTFQKSRPNYRHGSALHLPLPPKGPTSSHPEDGCPPNWGIWPFDEISPVSIFSLERQLFHITCARVWNNFHSFFRTNACHCHSDRASEEAAVWGTPLRLPGRLDVFRIIQQGVKHVRHWYVQLAPESHGFELRPSTHVWSFSEKVYSTAGVVSLP